MTHSIIIRVRNEASEVAKVRDALDSVGSELHLPERELVELQIVLDEIVSNVIKYSWSDGASHEFVVRITAHDDAITFEVIDDGAPFDPRRSPSPQRRRPPTRVLTPGGLGIHLIRKLVDGFDYRRIDGRNHTILTKKWVPSDGSREEVRE